MPVAVGKSAVGHNCVDYPITFYIASKAINSGTVVAPRIIAASSVYFGTGHPLNRTEVLYPNSEGYMPVGASTGPRLSIINRRSLLLGLLQALVSVKDIYRVGRATTCLHICVSSQYLDLVWNQWLPDWEKNGWPTREEEEETANKSRRSSAISISSRTSRTPGNRERASSRASTRMSVASRAESVRSGMSAMTGDAHLIYDDDSNRLINEDLLRKIAIFRRNFFKNSRANLKGAAYVQLINYRNNPADQLAKEYVKAASLDLTTQLPRAKSLSIFGGGSSIFNASSDSVRAPSLLSAQRSRAGSVYSVTSPTKKSFPPLPSLQETRERAISQKIVPQAAVPEEKKVVAASPIVFSRPIQKAKLPSSDAISGYETGTDVDEFDDAASTLSEEDVAPQSTVAKIVSLPTAAVAATVAAVMAPTVEPTKGIPQSVPMQQDASKGSFAKETEKALAAVKAPTTEDDNIVAVPRRASSVSVKAPPSLIPNGNADVQRKNSTVKAREGATMERAPSAISRKSVDVKREASTRSRKSVTLPSEATMAPPATATVKREPSARSTRSTRKPMESGTRFETSNRRVDPPPSPPPQPKKRDSFFSLRRRSKLPAQVKSTKSSEPYVPPMDRLIDYRPPQNRTLRANARPAAEEEQIVLSSPTEEGPIKVQPQSTSRGGPFSFFKKRGSVREVF